VSDASIHPLVVRPMSEANPGYLDVAGIVRLAAPDAAPHHLAVHRIEGPPPSSAGYSVPHAHHDVTELNILLPDDDGLAYTMVLGAGPPQVVEGPCVVVVPPGVAHSANILRGTGWFVVVRFHDGAGSAG
jgi:hypothetical protein